MIFVQEGKSDECNFYGHEETNLKIQRLSIYYIMYIRIKNECMSMRSCYSIQLHETLETDVSSLQELDIHLSSAYMMDGKEGIKNDFSKSFHYYNIRIFYLFVIL